MKRLAFMGSSFTPPSLGEISIFYCTLQHIKIFKSEVPMPATTIRQTLWKETRWVKQQPCCHGTKTVQGHYTLNRPGKKAGSSIYLREDW